MSSAHADSTTTISALRARSSSPHSEQLQKKLFDRISSQYEAHYDDIFSQSYRAKFIYEPVFEGINFSGMKVLEAMCGSGQTTGYLLARGATVTALDISAQSIESFTERWPQCKAVCASILDSGLESNSVDCAVVMAGLHHLHPHVGDAIRELHRVLKPGGYLCMWEPHSGSLPDLMRKWWYRHDSMFAENEASLDFASIKNEFSGLFSWEKEHFIGNFAYLLVLNSLIFRVPLKLKRVYTPVLMKLEPVINRFQGRLLSCVALAQWRKL
jgi:ubiquinone/menaquinone biosynthesis C-methylase UbiE